MLPRDKVSKAAWGLTQASTDAVEVAITQALNTPKFKLDLEQINQLKMLVKASIESGFHRAHVNFMRNVDAAISEALASVSVEEIPAVHPKKRKKKKK